MGNKREEGSLPVVLISWRNTANIRSLEGWKTWALWEYFCSEGGFASNCWVIFPEENNAFLYSHQSISPFWYLLGVSDIETRRGFVLTKKHLITDQEHNLVASHENLFILKLKPLRLYKLLWIGLGLKRKKIHEFTIILLKVYQLKNRHTD